VLSVLPIALGLFMIPSQAQLATRYVQQDAAVFGIGQSVSPVTELVAYHLLTAYADNLATAYDLTPGEIDAASFAEPARADCSPRSGSSSAPSRHRSSMPGLSAQARRFPGGGGTALQQLFAPPADRCGDEDDQDRRRGSTSGHRPARLPRNRAAATAAAVRGISAVHRRRRHRHPPITSSGRSQRQRASRRGSRSGATARASTPRSELFPTMTTLRETSAPHVRPDQPQSAAPAWRPFELFADHAMAARLWCVGGADRGYALRPATVPRDSRVSRTRTRDRARSERNVSLSARSSDLRRPAKLHEQHALLACSPFQRNPTGFDFPELLDKLFLPEAARKVRAAATGSAEEFTAKALHQKPEVLKLTVPRDAGRTS
jgi:hypothetical protein